MAAKQVPSVGRVVHYVLGEGRNKGEHRPAMIVRVWSRDAKQPQPEDLVNLQVLTDENNDGYPGTFWATSIHYSAGHEPLSYHWPEYVPAVEVAE